MALVDRVNECNNAKMYNYLPFYGANERIGWVLDSRRSLFQGFDCFSVSNRRIDLSASLAGHDAMTEAVDSVLKTLKEKGHIKGWRDERYTVRPHFGGEALFAMERSGCPLLGVRAWSVHVIGFIWRDDGPHFWVARRADHKPTYPGKLDTTIGGGQPEGLTVLQNLIDECAEEGGIPEDFARRAKPVGSISYRHETPDGLSPDQIFCFDLQLPPDFKPYGADGEVSEYKLIHWREVLDILSNSQDFKLNSALVYINFFLRHGLLHPDGEPDYAEICAGLGAN